jgi:hypothetical protein
MRGIWGSVFRPLQGHTNIYCERLCVYILPRALPHTAADCCTRSRALPHTTTAAHTATHCRPAPHCRTATHALPHCRTLLHTGALAHTYAHCRTAAHYRTAAPCHALHYEAHCHTLPRALRVYYREHCHALSFAPLALVHWCTAAHIISIQINSNKFIRIHIMIHVNPCKSI